VPTGKEHNFRKYNEATVTNFGVQYDYGSIMHYSAYAFSKNGKTTITPLVCMSVDLVHLLHILLLGLL
jgi:hypothetical protein